MDPDIKIVNTTPPPTPPPEPPKVKLPETEAELEQRRADVLAAMWGPTSKPADKPAEEPPAPPDEPAAAAPTAPAAPPGDDKKPETPPAAPAAPAAAAPVDAQDLIDRTAKKIGQEVTQAMDRANAAPEPEPEPDPEFIPEDLRDFEILAKLEEMKPDKKGLVERSKQFALRRYDYEAAWREKNPGMDFKPDDPEHEEFYKGQPEFDREDYDDAKDELRIDKKVAQRLKPIEEKAEAVERSVKSEKAMATAAPVIIKNLQNRIFETVSAVSEDVGNLLKTMNPLDLKPEDVAKLEDQDPILARVMGPMVAQELTPMLLELEKSVVPGAEYALDPRTNRIHAQIATYVDKFEKEAASKGEKRGGKEFLPISELNQKQADIMGSKASADAKQRKLSDLQSRYWTATVDDVQKAIVDDISTRAKAAAEDLDKVAKRKYKLGEKPAAAAKPATPPPAEVPPTPAANGKPRPPSVASQSAVVDTSRTGKAGDKSFGETAVAVHWGG